MRNILSVLFLLLFSQNTFSQNRAPSCWLKYPDHFSGDIIINTVRVNSPSPTYTYYCTLQWNAGMEGGGYCGIQEHPDGRNFIFSIWDPKASTDPITAPYTDPATSIENFAATALIEIENSSPNIRNCAIDITSLSNNAEYYIQFYILDIFDNQSIVMTDSFIKGSLAGMEDNIQKNKLSVYPNPFSKEISIKSDQQLKNIEIELVNILGEVIISKEYNFTSEITLSTDVRKGIYLLIPVKLKKD